MIAKMGKQMARVASQKRQCAESFAARMPGERNRTANLRAVKEYARRGLANDWVRFVISTQVPLLCRGQTLLRSEKKAAARTILRNEPKIAPNAAYERQESRRGKSLATIQAVRPPGRVRISVACPQFVAGVGAY